jgi:peptidoglycan/LPS O-acetylase OafA/YrhL
MPERNSKRLDGLDALRGIAAASVMLYHYTAWYPFLTGSKLPVSAPYGIFGVELFFVISGFVIFMTLERTPSLADFLATRVIRLYPAFLASMLATLWLTAQPVRPDQLFANLTMVPLALGQMPYDGCYWSLRFELEFYFLAALCVLVLRWRNPELPCTGWLAAEFLLRAVFGATPRQPLMDLTHTSFAHLFIIGIMLYRMHSGRATRLTVPLLTSAIAMALYGPHWTFTPIPRVAYMAIIASFALLVWLATTRQGQFLRLAPLRFLGRISYPLYLVHQAAGFALLDRLRAAAVPLVVAVPITITAAIMLAWVISTSVEWRAQRWLRAWIAGYKRSSRAAESNPRLS